MVETGISWQEWRRLVIMVFLFWLFLSLYNITIKGYWNMKVWKERDYWPIKIQLSDPGCSLQFDYILGRNDSPKYTILDSHILAKNSKSMRLTFEDLVKIPDTEWKESFDPKVQLVYPQAFNISDFINKLISQQPIPEEPMNGQSYRFLKISKEVCHPLYPDSHRYDIVIIVKSGVANFHQRSEFRRIFKAYTNAKGHSVMGLRTGLVFSVGLPRKQANNIFKRGEFKLILKTNGGQYLNPKGLQRIKKEFGEESSKFNDLVIGDFEDTYSNLTTKSHLSFLWASTFCRKRRPTVLFLDDDVPISLKYFVRVVRLQTREARGAFLHGNIYSKGRVFRFDGVSVPKWNVLKSEVPWPFYQTYAIGYFLLASFENVERLALGMCFTQKFPIDDAWIGIVSAKLEIQLRHVRELFNWKQMLTKQQHDLRTVPQSVFK